MYTGEGPVSVITPGAVQSRGDQLPQAWRARQEEKTPGALKLHRFLSRLVRCNRDLHACIVFFPPNRSFSRLLDMRIIG